MAVRRPAAERPACQLFGEGRKRGLVQRPGYPISVWRGSLHPMIVSQSSHSCLQGLDLQAYPAAVDHDGVDLERAVTVEPDKTVFDLDAGEQVLRRSDSAKRGNKRLSSSIRAVVRVAQPIKKLIQ